MFLAVYYDGNREPSRHGSPEARRSDAGLTRIGAEAKGTVGVKASGKPNCISPVAGVG